MNLFIVKCFVPFEGMDDLLLIYKTKIVNESELIDVTHRLTPKAINYLEEDIEDVNELQDLINNGEAEALLLFDKYITEIK